MVALRKAGRFYRAGKAVGKPKVMRGGMEIYSVYKALAPPRKEPRNVVVRGTGFGIHPQTLTLRARRIGCAENLVQIVKAWCLIPLSAELLIRETGRIARAETPALR